MRYFNLVYSANHDYCVASKMTIFLYDCLLSDSN